MSLLSRLRNLLRPDRLSDDIDREMAFHLRERADDLVARGMRPDAARAEARRRFGNYGMQKESTRDRDLFRSLDMLITDLRYAIRSLRSTPALALVAILSLALGIGANTAIFTLINAVILKSLPVSHPEELVVLKNDDNDSFTNPLWEKIRADQDVFSGVFAYGFTRFNLSDGGEARRVAGSWVSGDYFSTLGVRAILGRPLTRVDDYRGCPGTAVISESFWQSEYAGSPDVIGKSITIIGHPFEIVGVIEPGFAGLDVGQHVQVYAPICGGAYSEGSSNPLDSRSYWFLSIIGRPKSGVTPQQIRARFATLGPGIMAATVPPDWPPKMMAAYLKPKFDVSPAAKGFSVLRDAYTKPLYILMAVVGIVLLIACANVANLLLARATTRQREIAVRLALGASRGRLTRQLLTESVLLAFLGAAVGVVFAMWGSRFLVSLLSRTDARVSLDLSIDLGVLVFTIGVATFTGILFGLAPAWRGGRVDPYTAMKAQGRGVAEGHSRFSIGKALVVGQVSLSLVLVAAAGLLLGSWRRLATMNAGFRRDHVLIVTADSRAASLADAQRAAAFEQMLERLRGLPGVRNASTSTNTPLGRSSQNEMINVDGFTPKSEMDAISWFNKVSDGYFTTMGTRLIAGRDFDARDVPTSTSVAIVNEAFAKKFFQTTSIIGRRFRIMEGKDWSKPIEIVGLVETTKYRSLREESPIIAYVPASQGETPRPILNFEVYTEGDAAALTPAVKSALGAINPRVTLEFRTLGAQVSESLTLMRTLGALSGFFGALALLLSTIGLYGIMTYTVARRRNEIGVRIALGAAQARVIRMVFGEVGRMVGVGIVVGTALTLAVTRLVKSFLYGVTPSDPRTLALSACALLAVALGAAMLPAWRAARLDPVDALREE